VPNGTSTTGFIAGKPVGVFVHHVGQSKPCKREMTDSALVCPYCEAGHLPTWRGYTPFYDRDYVRRFVLIAEDIYESVEELPLHAQIRIARGKGSREGVTVRPELWRTSPLPPSKDRAAWVDLMPFLLDMWKDDELRRWVPSISAIENATRDQGAELLREAGARELDQIANRIKAKVQVKPVPDETGCTDAINRIKDKVGKNGKH